MRKKTFHFITKLPWISLFEEGKEPITPLDDKQVMLWKHMPNGKLLANLMRSSYHFTRMWICMLIIRQYWSTQIQVFKLDLIVWNMGSLINLNRFYGTSSSLNCTSLFLIGNLSILGGKVDQTKFYSAMVIFFVWSNEVVCSGHCLITSAHHNYFGSLFNYVSRPRLFFTDLICQAWSGSPTPRC